MIGQFKYDSNRLITQSFTYSYYLSGWAVDNLCDTLDSATDKSRPVPLMDLPCICISVAQ